MAVSDIHAHLQVLVGLPLSIARRAADLRVLHFGTVRQCDRGLVGDWALHVQCAWRLAGPHGIVTGRDDLWSPVGGSEPTDEWTYEDGNLQDRRLGDVFGGYDARTRSITNSTGHFIVERVMANSLGDATIDLSGGYTLSIFVSAADGEAWRFFRPDSDDEHFVIGMKL